MKKRPAGEPLAMFPLVCGRAELIRQKLKELLHLRAWGDLLQHIATV